MEITGDPGAPDAGTATYRFALQFLPEGAVPEVGDVPAGNPLDDDQIAAMLKDLRRTPLGIRRERDFRVSVAGAQEKTALLLRDGQWLEPIGTTPTTHTLKPAIGTLPTVSRPRISACG